MSMSADYFVLMVTAFFTSALSGVIGMGGGVTLFTVMAQYFPPLILIPVHGFVQLASNFSRAAFIYKDVSWRIVGLFLLGASLGALLGSRLIVEIPEQPFRIGIGAFILFLTFGPKPKSAPILRGKWFWVGGVATFLSLFVGPTGPLTAPFYLNENLAKKTLVATKAACQVATHVFKLVGYFLAGFVATPYLSLLAGMFAATLAGSYVGTFLLGRIPEKLFRSLFKILIAVLSLRMIVLGLLG